MTSVGAASLSGSLGMLTDSYRSLPFSSNKYASFKIELYPNCSENHIRICHELNCGFFSEVRPIEGSSLSIFIFRIKREAPVLVTRHSRKWKPEDENKVGQITAVCGSNNKIVFGVTTWPC